MRKKATQTDDDERFLPAYRRNSHNVTTTETGTPAVVQSNNTRTIMHELEVKALGEQAIEMTSPEQVRQRCTDYFSICAKNDMKTHVVGLALAFGIHRQTLWRYVTGQVRGIPEAVTQELERAYMLVEAHMNDYAMNGQVNPVTGIFLLKNHHGYQDRRELAIAPTNPLGEERSIEDLRKKYLGAIEGEYEEKPSDDEEDEEE